MDRHVVEGVLNQVTSYVKVPHIGKEQPVLEERVERVG